MGEVVAGAVLKHSRDFNLTRECVLGSSLDPHTPAYDIQQACGTGLEAAILVANKIALGQIDCGIAGGVDTTSDAPLGVNEQMRRTLLELNRRGRSAGGSRRPRSCGRHRRSSRTSRATPNRVPVCRWVSMPLSPRWSGTSIGRLRTSWRWRRTSVWPPRTTRGFFDDLMTPYLGLTRDQNLRPDTTLEKLAALKPVFGTRGESPTMTAGNSSALSDGASSVLLASEEWARRAACRCWPT